MKPSIEQDRSLGDESATSDWSGLCWTGGIAGLILIVYSFATMVQLVALGGPPATAAEAFRLLQNNRIVGLLRLDLPTVVVMPLYYFVFLGLFAALRKTDRANAILSTAPCLRWSDAPARHTHGSIHDLAQ